MASNLEQEVLLGDGLIICRSCKNIVPCKIVLREGFTFVVGECPFEKKIFEILHNKGPFPFFLKNIPQSWPQYEITSNEKDIKLGNKCITNFKNIPILLFAITTRCNSDCAICKSHEKNNPIDLNINFLRDILSRIKHKEIILSGGEPTVRDDLPEIIRMVRNSGNYPVIITNGLKLADRAYLRELKKSGLDHIHISFDGFKNKIYEEIRGGSHELELKLKALKNLEKEHIITIIRSTILKGINDDEIGKIINFAKENSYIVGVQLRPASLYRFKECSFSDKRYLVSIEEIRYEVCRAIALSHEEFMLWDNLKLNFLLLWEKCFPFLKTPLLEKGSILLRRTKRELLPFWNEFELRKLNNALVKKDYKIIMQIALPKITKIVLDSKVRFLSHIREYDEKLLMDMDLFSVRVDLGSTTEAIFSSCLINSFFLIRYRDLLEK